MKCKPHGNEATRDFLDVVTMEWFPICEDCYPVFLRLSQKSDSLHETGSHFFRYVPSQERFRKHIETFGQI